MEIDKKTIMHLIEIMACNHIEDILKMKRDSKETYTKIEMIVETVIDIKKELKVEN